MTSVVELSKVLTPENRDEVLPRFFQLSKREAKEVSAALRPIEVPPRRDMVTAARAPSAALALGPLQPRPDLAQAVHPANQPPVSVDEKRADTRLLQGAGTPLLERADTPLVERADTPLLERADTPLLETAPASTPRATSVSPPESTHARRAAAEPLSAELSRLHVTVSRRFLEKLDAARAALSHSHPGAGAEAILEAGLDLLLERDARRKGLVKKPRREPAPSNGDHERPVRVTFGRDVLPKTSVPAHVRRAVWQRDGGRCQFPLASGGICGSTLRLELDHVVPRARGGPSTLENLRVCCDFHNDLAARQVYGDDWMDRYTRERRAAGASFTPRQRPLE